MSHAQVPTEIENKILYLKNQLYTKGSIVREVKKITKDKELALSYVETILGARHEVMSLNPELYRKQAKNKFFIGLFFIVAPIVLILLFPNFLTFRLGIIIGPIYLMLALVDYIKSLRGRN